MSADEIEDDVSDVPPREGNELGIHKADSLHAVEPKKRKSYQAKALIRKTLKLQIRRRCTLVCQLAVPIIIVFFIGAVQLVFNNLVASNFDGDYEEPEFTYAEPLMQNWNCFSPGREEGNFFFAANPSRSDALGALKPDGTKSGFLANIQQFPCKFTANDSSKYFPYMVPFEERDDLVKGIIEVKEAFLAHLYTGGSEDYYPFPKIGVTFDSLEITQNGTGDFRFEAEIWRATTFPYLTPYFDFASMRYWIGFSATLLNAVLEEMQADVKVIMNLRGLPYEQTGLGIDVGSFMAAILYPLVLSFLLPVYMYNIVLEKESKLREMMKMMGMKMRNYWIITYLYDLLLYWIVCTIVYALSYAFGFAIFTQGSDVANIFLFFILWGNAQISVAFVFAALFNKTRIATIFGYCLVLITVIVSFIINQTVFLVDQAPFFWILYPPLAFYRAIFLLGIFCGADFCPSTSDYNWNLEVTHVWLSLSIVPFFLFFFAAYLDNVMPKEFGIRKSPFYCFEPIFRLIKKCFGCLRTKKDDFDDIEDFELSASSERSGLITKGEDDEEFHEPLDIAKEREQIYRQSYAKDSPIIISNLRKVYKSKGYKIAVHDLCLSIERGQCFGLLGPNGAGKTTTISMLTGLFPPTSGNAKVGGFDIRTEIDYVHRVMGVCPQFDTLWMDLTCTETLLFYSRLKGISKKEEDEHVLESLREVGLAEFGSRLVKDLSGGMRRRLSVAVALVGDPLIVFLDEPTTGLDPESRRKLWDVLMEVKKGKCIILTTHSMEEADVLCTRIGIMGSGRLQCIGSQQELKKRYGQGYSLKVTFKEEDRDAVVQFVTKILPNSTIVEEFNRSITFQIPRQDLVISDFFTTMQQNCAKAGIIDWGINETSLEDVFLNIVRQTGT